MKTQRRKPKDETRQQQTGSVIASIPLDSDEKLLYSEDKIPFESSTIGSALTLFLLLSSPLHAIVGFAALVSFISEKSLAQFCSEMNVPIAFMFALFIASIVLAKMLPAWNRLIFKAASVHNL